MWILSVCIGFWFVKLWNLLSSMATGRRAVKIEVSLSDIECTHLWLWQVCWNYWSQCFRSCCSQTHPICCYSCQDGWRVGQKPWWQFTIRQRRKESVQGFLSFGFLQSLIGDSYWNCWLGHCRISSKPRWLLWMKITTKKLLKLPSKSLLLVESVSSHFLSI